MIEALIALAATVTIQSCYDGDTCTTSTGEKVRLACIDTPELRGPRAKPYAATAAREFTRALLVGETVSIRRITTDRYGRTVAQLITADGETVGEKLVANGHAIVIPKYAHQCK